MEQEFLRFKQYFCTLMGGDAVSVASIVDEYALRGDLAKTAQSITRHVQADNKTALAHMHELLFDYYRTQFSTVPAERAAIDAGGALLDLVTIFEDAMLAQEEAAVNWEAHADVPTTGAAFVEWFCETARTHKAWNHPFYVDFLAKGAGVEDLRYYLAQETTLDPRFDDSLALIQIGTSGDLKLEIAGNYWDEMGGGRPEEVHTTLFAQALIDIGVDEKYIASNISLASKMSGNLSSALCLKRRHFHKAIGYFGVTEYMAPHRFMCVVESWRRNRLPPAGIIYHDLHIGVDAGHALGWLHNVVAPLVDADPIAAKELARGVLYRLNSSVRYLGAACTARLAQAA
jgi:hypothetical protein